MHTCCAICSSETHAQACTCKPIFSQAHQCILWAWENKLSFSFLKQYLHQSSRTFKPIKVAWNFFTTKTALTHQSLDSETLGGSMLCNTFMFSSGLFGSCGFWGVVPVDQSCFNSFCGYFNKLGSGKFKGWLLDSMLYLLLQTYTQFYSITSLFPLYLIQFLHFSVCV